MLTCILSQCGILRGWTMIYNRASSLISGTVVLCTWWMLDNLVSGDTCLCNILPKVLAWGRAPAGTGGFVIQRLATHAEEARAGLWDPLLSQQPPAGFNFRHFTFLLPKTVVDGPPTAWPVHTSTYVYLLPHGQKQNTGIWGKTYYLFPSKKISPWQYKKAIQWQVAWIWPVCDQLWLLT